MFRTEPPPTPRPFAGPPVAPPPAKGGCDGGSASGSGITAPGGAAVDAPPTRRPSLFTRPPTAPSPGSPRRDLNVCTREELEGMKAANEAMLSNQILVSHLADKGARIRCTLAAIERRLAEIAEHSACDFAMSPSPMDDSVSIAYLRRNVRRKSSSDGREIRPTERDAEGDVSIVDVECRRDDRRQIKSEARTRSRSPPSRGMSHGSPECGPVMISMEESIALQTEQLKMQKDAEFRAALKQMNTSPETHPQSSKQSPQRTTRYIPGLSTGDMFPESDHTDDDYDDDPPGVREEYSDAED